MAWDTITFSIGEEKTAEQWYSRNKSKYQILEIFVNNCYKAYEYRPLIKL
jgi:hypothetical protein